MSSKGLSRGLRRIQLDRALAKIQEVPFSRPREGWIKTAREVLGMTQKQLAERMSVSAPTLSQIEKAEVEGATTLNSLERAATALHCRVAYFLIPEGGSFEEIIRKEAHETATRAIEMASKSMHLESQGIDSEMQRLQIQQLAEEMVRNADKRIWELPK